jgi:hypothetical protein
MANLPLPADERPPPADRLVQPRVHGQRAAAGRQGLGPGPALVDVRTDRHELSLPPKLGYGEIKGFTLYATRMVLSGGGEELVELVPRDSAAAVTDYLAKRLPLARHSPADQGTARAFFGRDRARSATVDAGKHDRDGVTLPRGIFA